MTPRIELLFLLVVVVGLFATTWAASRPATPSATTKTTSSTTTPKKTVLSKWLVKNLPDGPFKSERDLELKTEEIEDIDSIPLEPDQILVKVEAYSIDAYVRTLLIKNSFHMSLQPGDPMRGNGYGTVIRRGSNYKNKKPFSVGSRVISAMLPVTNLAIIEPKADPFFGPLPAGFTSPCRSLDILGVSGISAYMGLFEATHKPPKRGETVVISAAAGGVGICAIQMAKIMGCKVVGIVGGPTKAAFLKSELGVDAVIDYKDPSKTLEEQLAETCPEGVDFFFDNVGGATLDALLDKINIGGRIIVCGAVSQYDSGKLYSDPFGPTKYLKLAERSASMSGFVLGHMMARPWKVMKAMRFILWNYWRGYLKTVVQIEDGIDSFGPALEKLVNGQHTGRLIVDVTGGFVP